MKGNSQSSNNLSIRKSKVGGKQKWNKDPKDRKGNQMK